MKNKILTTSLALFAGLFLFSNACFAGSYETYETTVETVFYDYSFVYEYQNNECYRVINDEKGNAKFYQFNINYSTGKVKLNDYLIMTEKLPGSVIKARENGATIIAEFVSPHTPSCANSDGFSYTLDDYARIKFIMKYNPKICPNISISDFVSNMNTKIPLIDYNYGRNLYYISFLGKQKVAYGFFNQNYPDYIFDHLVHPSIIKNNRGAFRVNSKINFYGEEQSCIGSTICLDNDKNSFSNGSAVKLEFYCPFFVKYIARYTKYIPDPIIKPTVPTKPDDPAPFIDPKTFNLKIHRLK